jgi:hypothetical protein
MKIAIDVDGVIKKLLFIAILFFALGALIADDYALEVWMHNKEKGGAEYFIDGRKVSSEQVTAAVKKIDKSSNIHIIVNKNCRLVDLYKLAEIIRGAGAENIEASVFIAVPSNEKGKSLEIKKIKFNAWKPYGVSQDKINLQERKDEGK